MKKCCLVVAIVLVSSLAPQAMALQTEEVLGLVAMPLTVAAVSEVTGVPTDSLISLVSAMNDVQVSPPQFVEIVRYSPVLLVDPQLELQVITFVTNEVDRGITDEELVIVLQNQIRANGIDQIEIVNPPRVVLDRDGIVPDVVVDRVDVIRNHPHGGPPGQVKKEIGVKTGAEVVHGTDPGRDRGMVLVDPDQGKGRQGPPAHAKQGRDKGGPPDHGAKGKSKSGPDRGKAKGKNRGDR